MGLQQSNYLKLKLKLFDKTHAAQFCQLKVLSGHLEFGGVIIGSFEPVYGIINWRPASFFIIF
jgi:hypothetical protein